MKRWVTIMSALAVVFAGGIIVMTLRPPGSRPAGPTVPHATPTTLARTIDAGGKTLTLRHWWTHTAGRTGREPYAEVELWVRSDTDWEPTVDLFELEFADGSRLAPLPPQEKMPVNWPHFEAGEPRVFSLAFKLDQRDARAAIALLLQEPLLRLDLPLPTEVR
jgi:hypothetical protein